LRKQLVLLGCFKQPLALLASRRRGIFLSWQPSNGGFSDSTNRFGNFCQNGRSSCLFDLENEGWAWEKALSSKEAQSQLIVFREWGLAFGVGTSGRFPLSSLIPCMVVRFLKTPSVG
jgi:hypothetical protein